MIKRAYNCKSCFCPFYTHINLLQVRSVFLKDPKAIPLKFNHQEGQAWASSLYGRTELRPTVGSQQTPVTTVPSAQIRTELCSFPYCQSLLNKICFSSVNCLAVFLFDRGDPCQSLSQMTVSFSTCHRPQVELRLVSLFTCLPLGWKRCRGRRLSVQPARHCNLGAWDGAWRPGGAQEDLRNQ